MEQPKLMEQVCNKIRFMHYSMRTEEAYLYWVRRFILFHNKEHPRDMGSPDIERFLAIQATIVGLCHSATGSATGLYAFVAR